MPSPIITVVFRSFTEPSQMVVSYCLISDTTITTRASGRFVLRVGAALHAALRRAAQRQGLSLNEYCVRRLAAPAIPAEPEAAAVVARTEAAFGEALVGLVLYGSWVRGQATKDSDVDLLVVLDQQQTLTRDLYRACEEWDLAWQGLPLQLHLVRLPAAGTVASSLWAEVALDGIVLWARDFRLSRWLAAVRRDIADGRLVRRTAHGQSYWTIKEAARGPRSWQATISRADVRLRMLDGLFDAECWADVVREAQEVVELALKGLLRASNVAAPRIHDVSAVLLAERGSFARELWPHVDRLAAISKDLRRDRELAFYGAEDLTPSSFYAREDAVRARDGARFIVETVKPFVVPPTPPGGASPSAGDRAE